MFWISATKFCIKVDHIITFQYTTEVYETKIRVTGVGAGSSMSRFAGIIMPFVCYASIELWGMFGVYWIFLIFSVIAFFSTWFLPYDTTGRPLDYTQGDS